MSGEYLPCGCCPTSLCSDHAAKAQRFRELMKEYGEAGYPDDLPFEQCDDASMDATEEEAQ
jgi:hypothetical protein